MKLFKNSSKTNKIITITATIVAVAALIAFITLICLVPQDRIVSPEEGRYTTVCSLGNGEWLYTTNDNVYRVDDDGEVKAEANVARYFEEKTGESCGNISASYKRYDGKNIYVATKTPFGGYVFRLDDDLNIAEYVRYNGNLKKMLVSESGEDFYLFAGVDMGDEVNKYNATDLASDYAAKGYIYTMLGGKDAYRLTYARDFRILCAEVYGDKLFIVHSNGIIAASVNFEMNSYKLRLEAETARIFAELKVEAGEDADEAELMKTAEERAKENLGVVSVKGNVTEVKKDGYDLNKYCTFIADTLTFRGALFRAEESRFYITAADNNLYYADVSELNAKRINGIINKNTVETITLPLIPEGANESLFYDASDDCAFVSYENSDRISKINLTDKTLEYTVKADFGVRGIFQSKGGSELFYFFYNKNRGSENLLCKCGVFAKRNENAIRVSMIISGVLFVVAAAVSAFSWVYATSEKNRAKLRKLGRDMAKAKWIYLAILVPVALLIFFCYYETFASIVLSFFDYTTASPTRNWNNFQNYKDIFSNAETLRSFLNMFYFLAFDLFTTIIPPIIFAFFLMTMKNRKYSGFTRTMLFIPGVIPGIAGLLIWSTGIFGQHGIITAIVELFGGTPKYWLADKATTRWALVFMGFPYVGGYLIFYGAMMNIPESYHEAAELEGITILGRLFRIDVPLIMPQIKYTFVTMFIHSVQNFARTYTTVGDGQSITTGVITPVHYMYRNVVAGNYGVASAYATIIFIFLFAATLFNFRKKKDDLGGE